MAFFIAIFGSNGDNVVQMKFTQPEAKEKINQLILRFNQLSAYEKRNYNEANTRKNYILPLFEALGWDIHEDLAEEDPAISGRVDYSFRINNLTQFLLEAKSISENLDKSEWAKQTIEYGWNMGVSWVVLTDFEGLKLFNSEENVSNPRAIFDLKYDQYLDNFDKLWLLSRESLEQNLLEKTLISFGIGSKRKKVNDLLALDLVRCRVLLTDNIKSWNPKIGENDRNESVQRILDRLVFIRVVEDKGIEDKILWQTYQKWQTNNYQPNNFIKMLTPVFREFDVKYNSNLFKEHACENLETEGEPFKKIIPSLYYNNEQNISYRFDAVNADVLGSVYEQYLGYLQKGKKDTGKRKKQGIYYTPAYIVDYIVRNTVGRKVEELNSYVDKQSIRILDPACGSGSFLINSLDFLDKYFRELNNEKVSDFPHAAIRKYRVLSENLFGVDLDEQAIEIARLNLLLEAVVPNFKLPLLSGHIKTGNSLIEDKRVTDKAFEWKKEFVDVFNRENPGFDVIIGNPPYIKEDVNKKAFDYLHNDSYYQGKMDLWTLFACRAIDLLREGGYLSFIAPSNWITNAGASIFRNKVRNEGQLIKIVDFCDFQVFKEASIQTMIFVFCKKKPTKTYFTKYIKVIGKIIEEGEISKDLMSEEGKNVVSFDSKFAAELEQNSGIVFVDDRTNTVLSKISQKGNWKIPSDSVGNGIDVLQDCVTSRHLQSLKNKSIKVGDGVFVLNKKEVSGLGLNNVENGAIKPYFTPKLINRYSVINNTDNYVIYADKHFRENIDLFPKLKEHIDKFVPILTSAFKPYGLHRPREERFFTGEAIYSIRKTNLPRFSYVNYSCYVSRAFLIIKPRENINLKYLTGILNSKVVWFWLKHKGKKQGSALQVDKEPLLKIPLVMADKSEQKIVSDLVDKVIKLNSDLVKITKNSDKYNVIQDQIKEIEAKIDREVYRLYGLDDKDISLIDSDLTRG